MTVIIVGRRAEVDAVEAMFVGQVAAEVGRRLEREVTPREVTALFYDRVMPDYLGPVVGGRRLIRVDAVDLIAAVLRERYAGRRPKLGGADGE